VQNALAPVHVGPDASTPDERRTLAWALAVGVLALLLNPHHYHALTLPVELSFLSPVPLRQGDARFQWAFSSPLQAEYFDKPLGPSIAGAAFFVLPAESLVSFRATWPGLRWGRLLVGPVFALLPSYLRPPGRPSGPRPTLPARRRGASRPPPTSRMPPPPADTRPCRRRPWPRPDPGRA